MFKKIKSAVVYDHPRLVVEEDTILLPDGKESTYIKYGYKGNGVVVVCKNSEQQILVLREYSYVLNRKLYLLPMGYCPDGEPPEKAALRELEEETGFRAESSVFLGSYYQNHRRSESTSYVYLVDAFEEKTHQREVEEVDIEMHWYTAGEIDAMILSGDIVDSDTLSAWQFYRLHNE